MPKTPPKGLGVTLYKNSPAIILIVDCLFSYISPYFPESHSSWRQVKKTNKQTKDKKPPQNNMPTETWQIHLCIELNMY